MKTRLEFLEEYYSETTKLIKELLEILEVKNADDKGPAR